MTDLQTIIDAATVIPVIALDDAADAGPLGEALFAGGIQVAELTLRTDAALEALKAMKAAVPEMFVGMGTVLEPAQAEASIESGADFLVTPGMTAPLYTALAGVDTPTLPGVATASEAMTARAHGYRVLKFFPAEQAGGQAYLKSLKGPLSDLSFCPTGSITPELVRDYLALPNVVCVGGSWLTPKALIEAKDWAAIEALAANATAPAAP